jgi:hypothetical protein
MKQVVDDDALYCVPSFCIEIANTLDGNNTI